MLRTLRLLLVGLAAIACLLAGLPAHGSPVQAPVQPAHHPTAPLRVTIPDPTLHRCVAAALGSTPDSEPTGEQLAAVTSLTCTGGNNGRITDLTGLEHLTGLRELRLASNQITDLGPLADLPLTTLLVAGNQVTDLSPLSTVTTLESLTVDRNPIISLAPLAPLVNLTTLSAAPQFRAEVKLTSAEGVQHMTNLTSLNLNNNQITDLSPLANLGRLNRLSMLQNRVSNLDALADLTQLTHLTMGYNQVRDIDGIAGLTRLTTIDLANNQLIDLSPLDDSWSDGMFNFRVSAQDAELPEVPAALRVRVPAPRHADGSAVPITAPAGVTVDDGYVTYPTPGTYTWTFGAGSTNTTYFTGRITQPVGEPVSDAATIPDSGLRSCLAEAGGLGPNESPSVSDLATIETLTCSRRGVTDLTGIELLSSATSINLADNPLADLGALGALPQLRNLDLSGTGLESAEPLATFTGLQRLVVDRNRLADLTPLRALSLDELSATGQTLTGPATPGGVAVEVPAATGIDGRLVSARIDDAAAKLDRGRVSYQRAGSYAWAFDDGAGFTGTITQQVTTDVNDASVHKPAEQCLEDGNVWVLVERDTGLQEGGCATEFGTGMVALKSAGFTVQGSGFITGVNGYPAQPTEGFYWSYWHASPATTSNGVTSYAWEYSELGADSHRPQPGTVEGWRFVSLTGAAPAPSWTPTVTANLPAPLAGPITWQTPTKVGHGWPADGLVLDGGDVNRDGLPDILLKRADGTLWFYAGRPGNRWSAAKRVGHGWNSMTWIDTGVDLTGDGIPDMVGRDGAGRMFRYTGYRDGSFAQKVQIGRGWEKMTNLAMLPAGGRRPATIVGADVHGYLWSYTVRNGRIDTSTRLGPGWGNFASTAGFADVTGDGVADLFATNGADVLLVYPGRTNGRFDTGRPVSANWGVMRLPQVGTGRAGTTNHFWAVTNGGDLYRFGFTWR